MKLVKIKLDSIKKNEVFDILSYLHEDFVCACPKCNESENIHENEVYGDIEFLCNECGTFFKESEVVEFETIEAALIRLNQN